VYVCDDSSTDGLLENNICDEINSLKYVFSNLSETFFMIIASDLTEDQESKLLKLRKKNKEAIQWILGDIKGSSPSILQHRIHEVDQPSSTRP